MILALITFASWLFSNSQDSLKPFHINGFAQGTSYNITYYATAKEIDKGDVDALLTQIDSSLSLYKPYSRINHFNQQRRGIKMDRHMSTVVKTAMEISAITNSSFDITCKPLIQLWNNQVSHRQPPNFYQIKTVQKFIGTQHLRLNNDSLLKDNPNVQIDCDGIAQ